jgi:hypothetical protein
LLLFSWGCPKRKEEDQGRLACADYSLDTQRKSKKNIAAFRRSDPVLGFFFGCFFLVPSRKKNT